MFVRGSLPGETSGSTKIPRVMVESLAPVLEAIITWESKSFIHVAEVVVPMVTVEVQVLVFETSVPPANTKTTTPMLASCRCQSLIPPLRQLKRRWNP